MTNFEFLRWTAHSFSWWEITIWVVLTGLVVAWLAMIARWVWDDFLIVMGSTPDFTAQSQAMAEDEKERRRKARYEAALKSGLEPFQYCPPMTPIALRLVKPSDPRRI